MVIFRNNECYGTIHRFFPNSRLVDNNVSIDYNVRILLRSKYYEWTFPDADNRFPAHVCDVISYVFDKCKLLFDITIFQTSLA